MSRPEDKKEAGPKPAGKAPKGPPLRARNWWFTNRVLVGMAVFFVLIGMWEFRWKPQYRPYYDKGISLYHAGSYGEALNQFQTAYQIDHNAVDVIIMMGWTNLKLKRWEEARYYFDRAIKIDPRLEEAQMGASFVALETGRGKLDPALLEKLLGNRKGDPNLLILTAGALEQEGEYLEAAKIYRGLEKDSSYGRAATVAYQRIYGLEGFENDTVPEELAAASRAGQTQVRFRAADGALWSSSGGSWEKFYVEGVDLGPEAPGYYPLSPPTRGDLYAGWIHDAAQMNANTLRVYTLLPPSFYRAYKHYLNGGGKMTLLQQVWVGEPLNHDLYTPSFVEATRTEIRNLVDVLHGRGMVAPSREQSSGVYDQDIAASVSGILLGGELDPVTVSQTNLINGGKTHYEGKYISIEQAGAAEVWYAEMLDYLVDYETATYNWQHPVAIENGPEHDPARGTITEEKLRATNAYAAGLFASYSAFPYYPESLTRDPQFLRARDAEGVNPVYGYLRLVRSRTLLPLVVSEYGLSTSMVVRRVQVSGWNQGGHDEESQAKLLRRLAATVQQTGCAGGLVFELADEWYRQGWMREGFETPADRGMLWLNDVDPNKRYGLIGYRTRDWRLFTGDPAAWAKQPVVAQGGKPAAIDAYDEERTIRNVQAGADEGYLYLRIAVACLDCTSRRHDGKTHLDRAAYALAINTLAGRAGLQTLPFGGMEVTTGADFLLYLGEPSQSRLLVAENYNPYEVAPRTDYPNEVQLRYRRGFKAGLAKTGIFVAYPAAVGVSPSALGYGSGDPVSKDYDSTAEWYADVKHSAILVRIPWGKLLVTDPSSLHSFYSYNEGAGIGTSVSSGVSVSVFALDTKGSTDLSQMKVAGSAPEASGSHAPAATFAWGLWNDVTAQPYYKRSYYEMQKEYAGAPLKTGTPVKRAAATGRPAVVR